MDKNIIEQVENIVNFYEERIKNAVSNEKVDTAIIINHLLEQAEKNNWNENYINAIKDIKKLLKITDSIYDLFKDTSPTEA